VGFLQAPGNSGACFFWETREMRCELSIRKSTKKTKRVSDSAEGDAFIEGLVKSYRESLMNGTAKLTASDFIRLVSMEKELADRKQIREIKVTWVQPKEMANDS
jgi:hypothetical protein